jgi:aminobenzoyl-glutamate utilization protein B
MAPHEKITKVLEEKAGRCARLSDEIWDYAELAFDEKKSSKALASFLEEEGFTVQWGAGGLPTAFTASWGKGRPVIGFFGEYDALPGLSQKAGVPEHAPLEPGRAGHGCGHHLLGTGSAAGALAAKEYLAETGLAGTIVFYGCPAEEGGNGKVFMLRGGAFDGLDAALSWHPSYITETAAAGTPAVQRMKVRFEGVSSHAAIAPEEGRSALDALELMNVGVNFLREHVKARTQIHYAITDPGPPSPNVVPAAAEGLFMVRYPDIKEVMKVMERLRKIAQGAALMTDTKAECGICGGVSGYIPNKILGRELFHIMEEIGPPAYDQSDVSLAAPFAVKGAKKILPDEIVPYHEIEGRCASAATDLGDVSQVIPMAQAYVGLCAAGTGMHTWQMVAQGKMPYCHKGMVYAARVLAELAAGLIDDPDLLQKAKAETAARLAANPYTLPIPEDFKPPQ